MRAVKQPSAGGQHDNRMAGTGLRAGEPASSHVAASIRHKDSRRVSDMGGASTARHSCVNCFVVASALNVFAGYRLPDDDSLRELNIARPVGDFPGMNFLKKNYVE